jgi:hypothetical protein
MQMERLLLTVLAQLAAPVMTPLATLLKYQRQPASAAVSDKNY